MSTSDQEKIVCVVTGGSQGIGRAIVQALLEQDNRTVVYSLDRCEPLFSPLADDTGVGGESFTLTQAQQLSRFIHLSTDVSDTKAYTSLLEEIFDQQGNQLDCLVQNAGIFETKENHNVLWDDATTHEQVDDMLNTNFASVVHGTRTAVKLMKRQQEEQLSNDKQDKGTTTSKKTIINIASTAALAPFPQHPVYCSTKAAVLQFTQTASIDLQSHGFRVLPICPGIIDTAMGRMGGARNEQAVAALKGGKRTSPRLVAQVVADWTLQTNPPEWNQCAYILVDNHEILPMFSKE